MKSQITIRTVKFANAVGATLCLVFLSGCGEDLRPKVADLESQLAKEKSALGSVKEELAKEKSVLASVKEELAKEKMALAVSAAKLAAFEKAETARAAEAASRATLTVQLGLTMKSGDTKPVTNAKVYLTRQSTSKILDGLPTTLKAESSDPSRLASLWALGMSNPVLWYQFVNQANKSALAAAIATADTDFNGLAVFEDIPKGVYFVICATALGGGAVLEKKVTISTSKTKVALSNRDVIE
jgi:hypothetical protein